MPDNPHEQKSNDWAVLQRAPVSQTQPTVPLPEEFALDSQIAAYTIWRSRSRQGWLETPDFSIVSPRQLKATSVYGLVPVVPSYEVIAPLDIEIPSLGNTTSVVSRHDRLYLVAFVAKVTSDQDPVLGQVTFQYRERQPDNSVEIKTATSANSDRMRSFWVWAITDDLDPFKFTSALPTNERGEPYLDILHKEPSGFEIGASGIRVYGNSDANLAIATYQVYPNAVQVLPACAIRRRQNFPDRGYVWGVNGEESLDPQYVLSVLGRRISNISGSDRARDRLRDLFAGQPGFGSLYNRAVCNFTAGQVPGNPGRPGEAAASPNGSVCLASSQRIVYSNQATQQKYHAVSMVASDDSTGAAVLTSSLNSPPLGTIFSENRTDHRVYSLDGTEQGQTGQFLNLGGSAALTWVGGPNSSLKPGQTGFIVPAIKYPAGSGLRYPFSEVERCWVDGVEISSANIRHAYHDDLSAYEEPANGEQYLVFYGPARAAIYYILKKITITTDAGGVASIPLNERGCFAFIEGVSTEREDNRIEAPVYPGLASNTQYRALVYYAPRTQPSAEQWQFQVRYAEYQGTQESSLLNGATVTSIPVGYLHTQGGGLSVLQGDGSYRLSPIAMHLPAVPRGTQPYVFDAISQLDGESFSGLLTFREYSFLAGSGLALPSPGQVLRLQPGTRIYERSISGQLFVGDRPLGFRAPGLSGDASYQGVLAFMVEKAGEERLVVATYNGKGRTDVPLDSDSSSLAFDTFRI